MKSGKHTARTVVSILLGLVFAVALAFEIVLNTDINKRVAARACGAFLDGADLQFSRLRVHLVPAVSLEMDSLSLTYPHERFAAYDASLGGMRISKVGYGRTESVDTLLSFDNLSLRMDTRKLLRGCFEVGSAGISGLRVFAHKYSDSGEANWKIFKPGSKSEKEKDSSSLSLPKVSVGELCLRGRTRLALVSHSDTLLAFAGIDTLGVALNAADTCADASLLLDGRAFAFSPSLGRIKLPFSVDGGFDLSLGQSAKTVGIRSFSARIAEIPIVASGQASSSENGLYIDAGAGISECDLPSLMHNYVSKFVKGTDNILTSGKLSASARARGLISDGHKPQVKLSLNAVAHAVLDSAYHFFPEGMSVGGNMDLVVDKPLEFADGAHINISLDTLKFSKDTTLRVRVRGMENDATLSFVRMSPVSKASPKLEFVSENSMVLLKSGANRLALRNAGVRASVVKLQHSSPGRTRRRMVPPPDSIPDFLTEKDFEAADVSISLDSGIVRLLRDYLPKISLSLESAAISSPSFPLRTMVNGLEASVSSNMAEIGYAGIVSGRSDLAVSGSMTGYRPLLMGRRGVVDMKLDVLSEHLNVNEMVAALQVGKENKYVDSGLDEDESFVVDSLSEEAVLTEGMPLVVVPANLRADVNILAENVRLAGLRVTPFEAQIQMRERCLQLSRARLDTDLGEMEMDAFYSTRTKNNLSVGADLDMHNVSADGIISLLPSVDNMMPMLKSFKGNMDVSLSATAALDTNMNVKMPSLDAIFKISGKDLTIEDAGTLRRITRLLLFKNPDIGTIDDLSVGGVVHDSRVEVFPFVLGVDRYTIALSGVQGFGGQMDYHASILKSPLLVRFGINVFGNTDKWKFRLGLPNYNPSLAPSYTQQIDSIQFNLASSIRDVYRRGADEVARQARRDQQRIRARIQADSLENAKLVLLDSTSKGFNPDSLESMIKLALEPDSVKVDSSAAAISADSIRDGSDNNPDASSDGTERIGNLKKKVSEHKAASRKSAAAIRRSAVSKRGGAQRTGGEGGGLESSGRGGLESSR